MLVDMENRRGFLGVSAGALGAVLAQRAPSAPASSGEEWRNRQPGVAYRKLGRTGYMVSEVVMGGNPITPANHEHVLLALDMGLNYLDTAPAYGRGASEQGYALVAKARPRDSFFLNTKVSLWDINRNKLYQDLLASLPESEQKKLKSQAQAYLEERRAFEPDHFCDYFPGQRRELEEAALANVMEKKYGRSIDREKNYKRLIVDSIEQSLKRLGVDCVDLMMCPHGANTGYELLNYPEIFEAFESLRKAGKARQLGVSAHSDPGGILDAAVKAGYYSVAMVAYNIINHAYVDAALERAHAAGLGVIAMKAARPVFSGRKGAPADDPARVRRIEEAVPGLMKRPLKAYVWALRNPRLSAVISEMEDAQMVRENVGLVRQVG